MREAGVNLVSLGMFTWALLEPERGPLRVRLAGPGPRPAARGGHRGRPGHPDRRAARLVRRRAPRRAAGDPRRHPLGVGGRQSACPSSPAYRARHRRHRRARSPSATAATRPWPCGTCTTSTAAPLGECYCEHQRPGLPGLAARHATATWTRSTTAWGTAFWGQRYTDWDEIDAAAANHTAVNPAQRLDFARFSVGRAPASYFTPAARHPAASSPRTCRSPPTSWSANCKSIDLLAVGAARSTSSPTTTTCGPSEPDNHIDLAMSADLTRSVAGGRPWLLMEHSTGAVNWQPRNLAKRPGEMRRNSLAHVARGADCGAVLPVAGLAATARRSSTRRCCRTPAPAPGSGARWSRSAPTCAGWPRCAGSRVAADVAIVWDWESCWALELDWRPSVDLTLPGAGGRLLRGAVAGARHRRLRPS